MHSDTIKSKLQRIAEAPFNPQVFIASVLEAYGITSPVGPDLNGNLMWPEHLSFNVCERGQPGVKVEAVIDEINANPEVLLPYFVMATDGVDIYCASPVLATIKYFRLDALGDCFDLLMPLAALKTSKKSNKKPAA